MKQQYDWRLTITFIDMVNAQYLTAVRDNLCVVGLKGIIG
jgi:hypothetical protein